MTTAATPGLAELVALGGQMVTLLTEDAEPADPTELADLANRLEKVARVCRQKILATIVTHAPAVTTWQIFSRCPDCLDMVEESTQTPAPGWTPPCGVPQPSHGGHRPVYGRTPAPGPEDEAAMSGMRDVVLAVGIYAAVAPVGGRG